MTGMERDRTARDVYFHKILGEKVILRPTTQADLPMLLTLWNDGRVMRWVGFPDGLGYDLARMNAWYDRLQTQPHRHHFMVEHPTLGFCGETYYSADFTHHRAGLDIKLIPEVQGRGLATDALNTLIAHIFAVEPEIDAVWTEPSAVNAAARALYARCGLVPKPRPAELGEGDAYWERTPDRFSGNQVL